MPGQRLNKCTCPGELHPNRGVGRGAPEIDVIEGEVMTDSSGKKKNCGVASQSLQLALWIFGIFLIIIGWKFTIFQFQQ